MRSNGLVFRENTPAPGESGAGVFVLHVPPGRYMLIW